MNKPITMYSTKTCGFCKAAKAYFSANHISYTEIDVGEDREKAREMIEKSGQMGVPVIVVGEGADAEMIVGWDEERIRKAISN